MSLPTAPKISMTNFMRDNSRFLTFGIYAAFLSSFGQTYMFGAYKVSIQQDLNLSESDFGFWYLLITIGSAVGLNLLGGIIDRVSLLRWTVSITLLFYVAFGLLYLSSSFAFIIIFLVFIRLFGQGLMVHTASTSMSRYFLTGRGKAISIAMLGIPVGQAILPYLATTTQQVMHWQTSWLLLAAIFILGGLPVLMLLLKGHASRHDNWVSATAKNGAHSQNASLQWRRKDMIKDYRFYCLLPNLLGIPFWVTAVFFFASDIAAAKGFNMTDYTALYVFNGLSAVLAPFLIGTLVDKHGGKQFLPLAAPILFLGMISCIYMDSLLGAAVFFFIMGLSMGASIPVNNSVWAELYGTKYLGEIKSLSTSIVVLSTALSPWLLGIMIEAGWDIITLMWGGAIHALVSIPLLIPVMKSANTPLKG